MNNFVLKSFAALAIGVASLGILHRGCRNSVATQSRPYYPFPSSARSRSAGAYITDVAISPREFQVGERRVRIREAWLEHHVSLSYPLMFWPRYTLKPDRRLVLAVDTTGPNTAQELSLRFRDADRSFGLHRIGEELAFQETVAGRPGDRYDIEVRRIDGRWDSPILTRLAVSVPLFNP